MTSELAEEIFREEGENFRSVYVRLEADGTVVVDTQDMGKLVEEWWGDSDYEFWVRIPPAEVSRLAWELIRKHYAGRVSAVDEIRDLCSKAGIKAESGSWA